LAKLNPYIAMHEVEPQKSTILEALMAAKSNDIS
jgi:hypothetical protein